MLKIMLNLFYQMFKVLILPLFLSMNLSLKQLFLLFMPILAIRSSQTETGEALQNRHDRLFFFVQIV